MKKLKYNIIALLFVAFTSCNDWLAVEPETSVDESKLFATEQGFKDAIAGVYVHMASESLYGEEMTFGFLDVLAQQYDYETMGTPFHKYYKDRDYDYADASVKKRIATIWNEMYSAISEINNILKWLDVNGNVLPEASYHRIKGECLLTRAYLHYDLLRLFAPNVKVSPDAKGIPYVTIFGVEPTEPLSVSQTIQLALEDIAEAKVELANDPILSTAPYQFTNKIESDRYVARANYYAADALSARIYLDMGDYPHAVSAAESVIHSGKFNLLNVGKSINVNPDSLDILFSDEHIFSLRNTRIRTYSEELHLAKRTETSSSGASLPLPSNISEIYAGNNDDIRFSTWVEVGTNYLLKYNREIKRFYPKQTLIRLSEMYLILAEAQLKTNNNKALETLNILRRTRITNPATQDIPVLSENEIVNEMRREFIGEGQLFFLFKRLNRAIPNILQDVAPGNVVFVFPIPDSEKEYGL
ncbi:hypothetical protein FACS1894177_04450 [Bacteroidia bacterium]|nr:hypothetical protein FACS1894177_04450 [Bacteroidia bacterium]